MSAAVSIDPPNMDLAGAEDELVWYFREAAACVGFRSSFSEESGGKRVFDEARSERLHLSKRNAWYRASVDRLTQVESSVLRLSDREREIVRVAYAPHGWTTPMRVAFTSRVRGRVCLAGLAERTAAATRQRDIHKPNESVREYLEWETGSNAEAKRLSTRLQVVFDEAQRVVDGALAVYDIVRAERIRTEYTDAQKAMVVANDWIERVRSEDADNAHTNATVRMSRATAAVRRLRRGAGHD